MERTWTQEPWSQRLPADLITDFPSLKEPPFWSNISASTLEWWSCDVIGQTRCKPVQTMESLWLQESFTESLKLLYYHKQVFREVLRLYTEKKVLIKWEWSLYGLSLTIWQYNQMKNSWFPCCSVHQIDSTVIAGISESCLARFPRFDKLCHVNGHTELLSSWRWFLSSIYSSLQICTHMWYRRFFSQLSDPVTSSS